MRQLLEQRRVTAEADENEVSSLDLVDHKKIGSDMALPEAGPLPFERMVAASVRQQIALD